MDDRRQRFCDAISFDTRGLLDLAFRDVAKEMSRLLKQHETRRRHPLTKRGESSISRRLVFRLLCKAFERAMLHPWGRYQDARRQRNALIFVLAAAGIPAKLHGLGTTSKPRRVRNRRGR